MSQYALKIVLSSVQWLDKGWKTGYDFSLRHRCVHTDCDVQPPSYPVRTWGSFPGCKAAKAWRWTLNST